MTARSPLEKKRRKRDRSNAVGPRRNHHGLHGGSSEANRLAVERAIQDQRQKREEPREE